MLARAPLVGIGNPGITQVRHGGIAVLPAGSPSLKRHALSSLNATGAGRAFCPFHLWKWALDKVSGWGFH